MQKLVMNSAANGAIRELVQFEDRENRAVELVDQFFTAVAQVFGGEWVGMSPRLSRLRHGAGIVAMGFVMDLLYSNKAAMTAAEFREGLELLEAVHRVDQRHLEDGRPATLPWNDIQNTPSDIDLLTRYLVTTTKRQLRKPRRVANG